MSRRRKGKRALWVVTHSQLGEIEFRASSKRNAQNQAMVRFRISYQDAKYDCTYRSRGKKRSGRPMPPYQGQAPVSTHCTPSRSWF